MTSPYEGLPTEAWENRTRELVAQHPLSIAELRDVVLAVWEDIFQSGIGSKPFKIGTDLFPRPQIMGFFLHELIPLELAHQHPKQWRRENTSDEKDVVCIDQPFYSIEIKTSSHPKQIFGNRSYTQETHTSKKSKDGYYLTINFEGFKYDPVTTQFQSGRKPRIMLLRFGWLDLSDWIGQTAASGQQARLRAEADRYKLLKIPLDTK